MTEVHKTTSNNQLRGLLCFIYTAIFSIGFPSQIASDTTIYGSHPKEVQADFMYLLRRHYQVDRLLLVLSIPPLCIFGSKCYEAAEDIGTTVAGKSIGS